MRIDHVDRLNAKITGITQSFHSGAECVTVYGDILLCCDHVVLVCFILFILTLFHLNIFCKIDDFS